MEILGFAATVGLIAGVTQVIKTSTRLPDRFAGLVSLGLGVAAGIAFAAVGDVTPELSALEDVFTGVAAGLSASGAYSAAKAATS